jgi:hypothetical protein
MSRITVPRHIQLICSILHAALDTRPDPAPPPLAALTESSCLLVEVAGAHPRGEQAPPGVRRTRLAEAIEHAARRAEENLEAGPISGSPTWRDAPGPMPGWDLFDQPEPDVAYDQRIAW